MSFTYDIDYRRLLIKYINHVGEIEGIDFLGTNVLSYAPEKSMFRLCQADIKILQGLSAEADKLSEQEREYYENKADDEVNL